MNATRIKICHIITTFEMGGAQLSTLRLLEVLSQKKQFELFLICGENGPLMEFYNSITNVKIIQIKELKRNFNLFSDLISFYKIIKTLKKESINIVHTHCSKPSLLGRTASIFAGIKCIHTYHGFGHDYYKNTLIRRLFIFFESMINYFSSFTVFVCKENQNIAEKIHLISKEKTNSRVIHDILKFSNNERIPLNNNIIRIISVLSFKEQKRPFELLKLASLISKNISGVEFIFIGDGPLLEECKKHAAKNKEINIRFVGAIRNVHDFYQESSLFIGCSRFEGLSMAELECLYYNIPMVITDAGGIKDIMIHGKQGFFYKYPNFQEALTYCKIILSKKLAYKSLNKEFFYEYKEDYVCNKYEELYSKLADY